MTDAERRRKSFGIGYLLSLAGKPLPIAQRAPIAYLYNGVQLPALPEWDRETYPYAVIGYIVSSKATYGYHVYLAIADSSAFWSYDGEISTTSDGELYCVTDENGEWKEWTEIDGIAVADLLWANHDIFYTSGASGALYLAASDPVPVGETPPERLKGYSYNGVILPAPPEYDAETYPYALIVRTTSTTGYPYEFRAYSSEAEWSSKYNGLVIQFGANAPYILRKSYGENSCGIVPATWCDQISGESGGQTSKSATVVWANFTGEYNGTVYWETSDEPTPIYE